MQLVVIGLIVGSIIALGAVGLTLVYGVLDVGDFAHGDKMAWGMFIALFVVSSEGANLGFQGGSLGAALVRMGTDRRSAAGDRGGRGAFDRA